MKRLIAGLAASVVVVGMLFSSAHVNAEPIQWSGNGHWYEAVLAPSGNTSWTDAEVAATAAGGYLACITSADENSFVLGLVANNNYWNSSHGPWLGGYQDHNAPDYNEPAGGWRWVSGEDWQYTNWSSGEPNNNGGEDRLEFFGGSGCWNDLVFVAEGTFCDFAKFWRLAFYGPTEFSASRWARCVV